MLISLRLIVLSKKGMTYPETPIVRPPSRPSNPDISGYTHGTKQAIKVNIEVTNTWEK